MPDFVHLHNHTHYSLLDAINTPKDLIDAAVKDNQKAIAITDHGVMFGCFEFYLEAKKTGIKPIIGFEAYVSNGSRFDKSAGKSKTKKRNYFHLILLAKNDIGYHNLMKLTTYAHTEGFYYKPRIDKELIEKYNEGIIATSACIAGVVNAHLIENDYDKAFETAKYYKDVFGEDFYLELQNHNLPDDKIILRDVPKIAKELDIKMVATNDIHYLSQENAYAHNVHLLIDSSKYGTDEKKDVYKLRYRTPEMYFKTTKEMTELFKDFPESIENTVEIADKCNLEIDTTRRMPQFDIPPESKAKNLDEYLVELTYEGLNKKYPELTDEIKQRADYELSVISKMGFPGYFLIVRDFIKAAKDQGIRVGPGRGSAVGSIVSYALDITTLDPLPYNLLFERFLNPERVSMPDIDIDFADNKRDKVIEYVKKKYGEKSVAQIITFGKLSSKAVLKDVGRVLGIHHSEINDITSKIPSSMGKVMPLKDAINLPELKHLKKNENEKFRELIKFSLTLEGKNRHSGVHAAGVVIAPGDVSNYVPVFKPARAMKNQVIEILSQYSMSYLEMAGLLKMDFLGLRTLSIIDNTLEMIKENHGEVIDIDNVDIKDEQTYKLLSDGNTLGVFQFESSGMQEYLKQLKPNTLDELVAMNALYRPGPMSNIPEYIDRKFGRKKIEYLHPLMEKSLKETYGIIVYQEQVMQLVQDLAGFTLGGADVLRRVMGKKKVKEMAKQKPIFIEGCKKNGIDKKLADEIFHLIETFANYGFNKSHALAYAYIAFQTAWLKVHYPEEFLAANMTAEINTQDSKEKITHLIEEASKFGIKVLPPNINTSNAHFTSEKGKIYFGLAAIKNVGEHAVEDIVKSRANKPYKSFFEFISRASSKAVNRKTLEALICSGVFDTLGDGFRSQLFETIDSALEYAKAFIENKESSMDSLFGGNAVSSLKKPILADVGPWTDQFTLEKEKEFLGFYVSGHPLNKYRVYLESLYTTPLNIEKSKIKNNENIVVCGMITNIRNSYDKKQNPIAFVTIEDFNGKAECVFWSENYQKYNNLLKIDNVVMLSGKANFRRDVLSIIVDEIDLLEKAIEKKVKGFNIWFDIDEVNMYQITELFKLCNSLYSKNTIRFNISNKKNNWKKLYIAEDISISIDTGTINKVVEIFGRDKVRLINY